MPAKTPSNGTEPNQVQGQNWSLVLERRNNAKGSDIDPLALFNCLKKMARSYCFRFWFVLHNEDYDANGEKEREHFQCVFRFSRKQSKSVLLKVFPFWLDCSPEMIGLQRVSSLSSMVRYTIHLDELDPGKFHYSAEAVYTNDLDYFQDCISVQEQDKTATQWLISSVVQSNYDVLAIIRRIGAESYQKYRWLILDLITLHKRGGFDDIQKRELF